MSCSRLVCWVWACGVLAGACVWCAPARGAGCPDEGVREKQTHGLQLPDCRAYEQVSPVDKNDVDAKGFPSNAQASPSGELVRYYSITPFPPAVEGSCAVGGALPSYISSRGTLGEWATEGILPCGAGSGGKVGVSEDLSEALVWAEGVAFSADAPVTGRSYYVRYTQPGGGARYRLLATVNPSGTEEGYDIYLAGFSADDRHVLIETEADLLPGEARAGAPNVYEVDLGDPEGQGLSLVGVLPAGEGGQAPAGGSIAGAGTRRWRSFLSHFKGLVYTQSAVSQDGSRVFFTALPSEQVYVRENPGAPPSPTVGGKCTVPADACTLAVSQGAAHFRTATPDGAYAFYTEDNNLYRFDVQTGARETIAAPVTATATGNLTSGSTVIEDVEPSPVGVFHVGEEISGTGLTGGTRVTAVGPHTLTLDLVAEATLAGVALTGSPVGVLGVLGVSDDGRAVYYAASGVLSANANSHGETAANEPEITDLYESYQGAAGPTFIARLDNPGADAEGEGDEEDWNDHALKAFPVEKTSRVTGNGETVLFASRLSLTGYDNAGPCGGARHECSELYRYRAGAEGAPGRLTCVSCNPKRSTPPAEDALLTGEGGGIHGEFEAVLTRNLSENGQRVFFQTPDALVADDTDNQTDVYEWEADGEGSCRSETQDEGCLYLISSGSSSEQSYFGDASANGNDVFFFTRQPLAVTDTDNNVDIYDARVCVKGDATCEEEAQVEPAACIGECAGPESPPQHSPTQPAAHSPATATSPHQPPPHPPPNH